jgi:hypothetical protein
MNHAGYRRPVLFGTRRGRDNKLEVHTGTGIETIDITDAQRKDMVIEKFGFSPEIVARIRADTDGGPAPF